MLLTILPYIQMVVAILLITTILLQKRGAGLGAAFGGGEGGSYATRRGFDKILFYLSVVLSILFIFSAFINLLLR